MKKDVFDFENNSSCYHGLMLFAVVCIFSLGCACKGIRCNDIDSPLFLATMPGHGFYEEVLTTRERDTVLRILSDAKFTESPKGSPSPSLKYVLEGVVVSGLGQKVYFMDDGTLLAAKLPEEKALELSRVILDIGERMKGLRGQSWK